MLIPRTRATDLDDAYFFVDNNNYAAFVPLNMIASLHTAKGADEFYDVILTTVSGKEFMSQDFSSHSAAIEFCKEQMWEISRYNAALAEATISKGGISTLAV